jgi:Leucine-rich repeat (LRR) protein
MGALIGYTSLRYLSFRNNEIKNVNSRAFQGLHDYLTHLDLSNNQIHTIESTTFSYTAKLQVLLVSNNSIAVLHEGVFTELTELQHLDLSFNLLSQVPDGTFHGNWQLEFLSLRHNAIDSVSKLTFRVQHNLKHLDLSQNKISVIVQDAFLTLQQLEWLSLAQNRIKTVSTNLFEKVKNVLHLNLSDNAIDSINRLSFSQCSQLQTLSIAHNLVSELSQQALYGLFNLTHLDLSHNRLTHFGPEVFEAPNVSSTDLPTNNSACPQYQSLYRLKLLNLNNNHLRSLDRCVFAPTSQLQNLSIAHNFISELPQQALYGLFNLTHLDLSHNNLTHFGPEVFSVPDVSTTDPPTNNSACPQYQPPYRLKLLNLNNNQLESLDICAFAPTSNLQTVDLAANNLTELGYRLLPQLENCSSSDIRWNRLSTVDVQPAQWLLDKGSGIAVNLTGKCCVFSV